METKICPKCGKEKPKSEFYKEKRRKDGLKCWCKECHLADSRKREKEYNETRKNYRETHKEEYRANKRKYYVENKEKIDEENRKWQQTFKGRLYSYKISAKKRNISWLLTEEEFTSFWGTNCSYCGGEIKTIGIDRIDSNKPYELSNCTSCCSICNKMKMDLSEDKFFEMISKIYHNKFDF